MGVSVVHSISKKRKGIVEETCDHMRNIRSIFLPILIVDGVTNHTFRLNDIADKYD